MNIETNGASRLPVRDITLSEPIQYARTSTAGGWSWGTAPTVTLTVDEVATLKAAADADPALAAVLAKLRRFTDVQVPAFGDENVGVLKLRASVRSIDGQPMERGEDGFFHADPIVRSGE